MTNLFVRSGISFVDRSEVLTHLCKRVNENNKLE